MNIISDSLLNSFRPLPTEELAVELPDRTRDRSAEYAARRGLKPVKPTKTRNWLGQPRQKAIPGSLKAKLIALDAGTVTGIEAASKVQRNALYSVARRLAIPVACRGGVMRKRKG